MDKYELKEPTCSAENNDQIEYVHQPEYKEEL